MSAVRCEDQIDHKDGDQKKNVHYDDYKEILAEDAVYLVAFCDRVHSVVDLEAFGVTQHYTDNVLFS